jgi:hypothetical protein
MRKAAMVEDGIHEVLYRHTLLTVSCVFVCVCVCQRERERENEGREKCQYYAAAFLRVTPLAKEPKISEDRFGFSLHRNLTAVL